MTDQEQSDFYVVLIMSLRELTLHETLITLLFELILVRSYKDSKESFAASNYFVISLVPDLFFGGKSTEGSKDVVVLLLPQISENSDTRSALLGENELQQLSNKWKITHAQ